jgi:PAS domain S-box-containing protein
MRQKAKTPAPEAPAGMKPGAAHRRFVKLMSELELIAVLLDRQGHLVDANDFLFRLTGYEREESLGCDWFDRFVPSDLPDVKRMFLRSLRKGTIPTRFENPIRVKGGEPRLIAWNNTVLRDRAGRVVGTASIGEDIAERRWAERALFRANRFLRSIAECSELLVRAGDERTLLDGVCRLLVEHGGYRMVWVGFAGPDGSKEVHPVAKAGFEEGDLLAVGSAEVDEEPDPAGAAIRTGRPWVSRNLLAEPAVAPWRDAPLERGYASSAAIPLAIGGRVEGVLVLFAALPDAFDADEMRLLSDLADDLAYGLDALRTRVERNRVQEQLRTILESIGDGFYACDREWRLLYVNAAAERLLNLRREEMLGESLWEVLPLAVGTEVEREFRLAAAGEARDFESFHAPRGLWFHQRCFPREPGGISVYFRDVTGQKMAETALAESEDRFRAIFETAADGLFLADAGGERFTLANRACLGMLGYTLEEFTTLHVADLHLPEDLPFIREEMAKFGRGDTAPPATVRFRRKDGSVISTEVNPTGIRLGGRDYALVAFRDVSDRMRMESELRQSHEALRALLCRLEKACEGERTRIARDIHDDFGQGLTAIKMDLRQIERIAERDPSPSSLEAIRGRAAGAIGIADGALAKVQELAAGLRPGVLDRLGLGPALRYEARRFQEHHGIRCSAILPATLPDLDQEVATTLFRIFQECLTNVLRHAAASQVTVELGARNDALLLWVRDDGVGIPEAILEQPATLGLLGMRERAAALGGTVTFARGDKCGTVVTVRIPEATSDGTNGRGREEPS